MNRRIDPNAQLTVAQVAKMCGVETVTVRSWIKRRRIKRNEHGRIRLGDVIEYLTTRDRP